MKKLFLFIILILAIVIATPLIGGYIYKKDFDKMIARLNQDPKTSARVEEYHFGWLKSYVKIILEAKNNASSGAQFPFPTPQVILDQEVIHGPIIFDAKNKSFSIGEAILYTKLHFQPLESLLGRSVEQGMMSIRTLVSYHDSYLSTFTSPAFVKEIPGKVKLAWGGFKGTADMLMNKQSRLTSATYDLTVAPFSVDSPLGPFQFYTSGLTSKSDIIASALPGLYTSSHIGNINKVSYNSSGKEVLSLDALNSTVKTKVDNNLFNLDVNINLGKLNIPGQIEIKPANFNLAFNDFNGSSIVKISNTPYDIRKNNIDLYSTTITPTSNVKGDLTVTTSQGNLNVTMDINWKGQTATTPLKANEIKTKTNVQVNLRIAMQLLNYIVGIVDGPKAKTTPVAQNSPAANSFRAQIDDFINRGYLTVDKSDYTMLLVMEQGRLKINGKDYVPAVAPTQPPTTVSMPVSNTNPSITTDANQAPLPAIPSFQVEQDPRSQI